MRRRTQGARVRTRVWFLVHSFLGVTAGLLLFIVCWSGTFATLAHEIDWLVTPAARVVPDGQPHTWGKILGAVYRVLPDASVRGIQVPSRPSEAVQILVDLPEQERVRVFVNPYTLDVQGVTSYLNVWRFFRSFHRRFFLQPTTFGILLVAAIGLALAISTGTALLFYKRWWRRFLRFRPRDSVSFWSDTHKLLGLWSIWFAVVIAVTGVWYGIERLGVLEIVFTPVSAVQPVPEQLGVAPLPIDNLYQIASEARPDIQPARIEMPGGRLGMALRIDGHAGNGFLRKRVNHVVVDAYDGRVIANRAGKDLTGYQRWVNMADPLHFGIFGGLTTKLVWFVFGLVLSGLALTGTFLYAIRVSHCSPSKALQRRWRADAPALMASTLLLCATIPLFLREARTYYGPEVNGVQVLPEVAPGVLAVLLTWSAATILILMIWWRILNSRCGVLMHSRHLS